MKARKHMPVVRIVLELELREAIWLKDYLQNPRYIEGEMDNCTKEESELDAERREAFFNSLREAVGD